ncbi:hypothetical protein [Streptodolium elevatio]|uniref:Uncharacterized protein n=1 Tax=Streptodolium elevatio TaxID=3157996 RepID=A0ABV3DI82_9ACTN
MPRHRAAWIRDHYVQPHTHHRFDDAWFLALLYAMLLDEDPRCTPTPSNTERLTPALQRVGLAPDGVPRPKLTPWQATCWPRKSLRRTSRSPKR